MAEKASREYYEPPATVFSALLDGLPRRQFRIVSSDSISGVIRAKARATVLSWGEKVTIHVRALPDDHTAVTVESRFRFIQTWSYGPVHEYNFRLIFDMLDWRLGPSRSLPAG
jgi:hypothetical protein